MEPRFDSALSTHDDQSIAVRELDLAEEVMGELTFAEGLYYLWTGDRPSEGERRVLDAVLTSIMVHGITPSSLVSRLILLSEPDAVQAAVAGAVGGVGSRLIGTMKECATDLQELQAADDRTAAVEAVVERYREAGERFPGIGHPHLDPVDPRAQRLFEIAEDEGVAGEHVESIHRVRDEFEAATGATLPINATGAIAAVTSDMGLSPTAARGLAMISRAGGVVGEILEEQDDPMARDVWQFVDERSGPPRD